MPASDHLPTRSSKIISSLPCQPPTLDLKASSANTNSSLVQQLRHLNTSLQALNNRMPKTIAPQESSIEASTTTSKQAHPGHLPTKRQPADPVPKTEASTPRQQINHLCQYWETKLAELYPPPSPDKPGSTKQTTLSP